MRVLKRGGTSRVQPLRGKAKMWNLKRVLKRGGTSRVLPLSFTVLSNLPVQLLEVPQNT
jgi:hypothetical protein